MSFGKPSSDKIPSKQEDVDLWLQKNLIQGQGRNWETLALEMYRGMEMLWTSQKVRQDRQAVDLVYSMVAMDDLEDLTYQLDLLNGHLERVFSEKGKKDNSLPMKSLSSPLLGALNEGRSSPAVRGDEGLGGGRLFLRL